MLVLPRPTSVCSSQTMMKEQPTQRVEGTKSIQSDTSLFQEHFNESVYNSTLWNYETYGNGSISWIDGEIIKMQVGTHAFRTLSSKMTFTPGKIMDIRMQMDEDEAVVCIGWTNSTNATSWNYLFTGDRTYVQFALDTVIVDTERSGERYRKLATGTDISRWHTYRIVWHNEFTLLYIDGIQKAVIGNPMPEGPLHFKIGITEFRNRPNNGWIAIDEVRITDLSIADDLEVPIIDLNAPGNGSRNLMDSLVDVVVIGSDGNLTYSWDDGSEVETSYPYDIRIPKTDGNHSLRLFAKDGLGMERTTTSTYIFQSMVQPPRVEAVFTTMAPVIDGVIRINEYPEKSLARLTLDGIAGNSYELVMYIIHTGNFLYFAINSTIPSGHDSRAAILVSSSPDAHFHGKNQTPISSAMYVQRSPDAWDGYDELVYVFENDDGLTSWNKVMPIPVGFLSAAELSATGVHYEFRLPLSEFITTSTEENLFSVILIPSGMGVDSFYYPIFESWKNASRLAILELEHYIDPIAGNILVLGAVGLIGVGLAVGMYRKKDKVLGIVALTPTESRINDIIQSYHEITLEKLANMLALNEKQTTEVIQEMIGKEKLLAVFHEDRGIIQRT